MRRIRCSWNSVHAWNGGITISWCSAFQWPIYWWGALPMGGNGAGCGRIIDGVTYVGRGRLTPPISRMVFCSVVSSSVSQMIRPRDCIASGWCTVFAIVQTMKWIYCFCLWFNVMLTTAQLHCSLFRVFVLFYMRTKSMTWNFPNFHELFRLSLAIKYIICPSDVQLNRSLLLSPCEWTRFRLMATKSSRLVDDTFYTYAKRIDRGSFWNYNWTSLRKLTSSLCGCRFYLCVSFSRFLSTASTSTPTASLLSHSFVGAIRAGPRLLSLTSISLVCQRNDPFFLFFYALLLLLFLLDLRL